MDQTMTGGSPVSMLNNAEQALVDVRCPECGKMLFKAALVKNTMMGLVAIEIKCGRCHSLVRWPN